MTLFKKLGITWLLSISLLTGCERSNESQEQRDNTRWDNANCSIISPGGEKMESGLMLPEPLYTLTRTNTVYTNEDGTFSVAHDNGISVRYSSVNTLRCDNYSGLLY